MLPTETFAKLLRESKRTRAKAGEFTAAEQAVS